MSSKIGAAHSLRIEVEAVDVELDEDGSISHSSLQSAFPGCSGLYYKGTDCRRAVRFDGKKFQPPGGAWNDRSYFVSLGARCHAPFGSYETASKQFERSVTAVQRMLGSSVFEMPARRSLREPRRQPATGDCSSASTVVNDLPQISSPVPSAPVSLADGAREDEAVQKKEIRHLGAERPSDGDILEGIEERGRQLKSAQRRLQPIEQQFIDLARISTGKDQIIEGLRQELKAAQGQAEQNARKLADVEGELLACQGRLAAQEEELNLLRGMSAGQTNTNERVSQLSSELLRKDEELSSSRAEAAQKIAALTKEGQELRASNSSLSVRLEEAKQALDVRRVDAERLEAENEQLLKELDGLRQIRDELKIETVETAAEWRQRMERLMKVGEDHHRLSEAFEEIRGQHASVQGMAAQLTEDNTRLLGSNKELRARVELLENELDMLNQKWKQNSETKEAVWEEKRTTLEAEVERLRGELEQVRGTLSTVTRDAAASAQRSQELEHSRDELRRTLDSLEYKAQEPLKRQIRALSEQLAESQQRCKELNGLVSSLTSDARNSQHEAADFLYETASRI
ncbi:unnamed protein product, partial [Mesorhabditis spiculigera]